MADTLTEADVGKTVVTEDGEKIGEITAVESNVASVKPDRGLTEKLKETLGWEDTDTYRLQEEAVSSTSDDRVVVLADRI